MLNVGWWTCLSYRSPLESTDHTLCSRAQDGPLASVESASSTVLGTLCGLVFVKF